MPCGSTGESATLDHEEHLRVIEIVRDQARKAKVLAGAGSNCTREAVMLSRSAQDIGADGVLSIAPYYVKPTQEGLFRHFEAVADAVDIPVIVYNIPGRTGVNITSDTLMRIAEVDGIAGVKEASGNMAQIQDVIRRRPEGFEVLSGDDALTLAMICLGGDGVISVTSNCCPALMSDMVRTARAEDVATARSIQSKLLPLFSALFVESNPIPIKYVMGGMGYGNGEPRLPLTPLSEAGRERIDQVLKGIGLARGHRASEVLTMITVMKFGGTSVGSAEALKRVAKIVADTEGEKVVVVSAMSGITNFLVSVADNPQADTEVALSEFANKHLMTAAQLFEGETMEEFRAEFDSRMEGFRGALAADRGSPWYKDAVVSQGERFSSLMLAFVLRDMGLKSVALTSEDVGIVAVGNPGNGSADLLNTATGMTMRVRPLLSMGVIPIITGFYGMGPDRQPLTFGRGGSDYSAAVVANAIDADILEIWTDVDGFMTADPRIIPDAKKIPEMNFGEAAELAYFGAKVLHPRTIEPVRLKHIPLKVKNSFRPEEPGTLIHHLRKSTTEMLRSVAAKTDLSIITISSAEIAYRPAMVARIIDKIAEINVIIYSISTTLSSVAFLVHNNDVKMTLRQLNGLSGGDIERIDVKNDVALICAVGDNLLDKCGVSGDVFGAVKEANANVEMISEGASDVSLNFVVPMSKVIDVVRTLHGKFIGGQRCSASSP